MEEHLFFKNSSGKELFGAIHYPGNPGNKGVLICHPLFEEKLHVHRVLVDLARFLSSSGFKVMRFDYFGDGDSAGEFEEATVETRLADIGSALEFFRKEAALEKIVLLGVRFGATLSSLFAEKETSVDGLILWAPVLRGNDYLQQLLRMNLTHQVVVYKKVLHTREQLVRGLDEGKKINVEGYEITRELYHQVSGLNLLSKDKGFKGKTLLVQLCCNSEQKDLDFEKLTALYSSQSFGELQRSTTPPFWSDMKYYPPLTSDLFGKTLNWLTGNL